MSITRVKTGWQVKARVKLPNGKIVQKQDTVADKTVAARLELELKEQIRKEYNLNTSANTFSELVDIYLARRTYSRSHIAMLIRLNKLMGSVSISDAPDKLQWLLTQYKERHIANRYIALSRAVFNVALAQNIVLSNPITKSRFVKSNEVPRDVYYSLEVQKKIVLAAAKDRNTKHIARLLQYALQVPCRKTEIINMKVGDVDLDNKAIRVFNGTTKNGEGLWKPIPPTMLHWFSRRVANSNSEDYIFTRNGKYLGDFKNAWKRVQLNSGIKMRIHDTRHISATDMIDRGTPEQVVMDVAGWKSDMLRIYYHRNPKKMMHLVKW